MALPALADTLEDYEKNLFGQTYGKESTEDRLKRIEASVFGEAMEGSITEREARLKSVLKTVFPEAAATPPTEKDAPGTVRLEPDRPKGVSPPPPPQDVTDYPAVTAVEQVVYSRQFTHEDITARLDRLERKLFERTFPHLALSDRVDQLQRKVPVSILTASPGQAPRHRNNFTDNSKELSGPMGGLHRTVDQMERRTFGNVSQGKLLTERLDALERRNFGRTFGGESIDTRISRLQSFLQYSVRPQFPRGYQPNPEPQVSVGSTTGMTTKMANQLSPEMVDMLPNDVRQQVYQRQYQQRGPFGTTTSRSYEQFSTNAPGTVVYQETRTYPGYAVTNNPNFSRYAPYSTRYGTRSYTTAPGGVGTQMSSPVMGPRGTQRYTNAYGNVPYTYTQTRTYTSSPQYNQPPPGFANQTFYTVSPEMIRQLEGLEKSVFGQINQSDSMLQRISKLELKLTGQVYSAYPPQERLNNLTRVRQGHALGKLFGKGKASDVGRGVGSYFTGLPLSPPDQEHVEVDPINP